MNIATSGLLASFQMGIEAVFAQSQGFGWLPDLVRSHVRRKTLSPTSIHWYYAPIKCHLGLEYPRPSFGPGGTSHASAQQASLLPRLARPPLRTARLGRTTQGWRSSAPRAPKTDRYGDPLPPGAVARLGSLRFRNGDAIFSVVFSPDGKYLATTANDKVRWWDVATAKQIREFRGHPYGIDCLAISPNGTVLASGSNDGTFRLWDIATGQEICCVQGHVLGIGSMAFSPDGKTLATAGRDTKIRLWNASTRKKAQELAGHNNSILSITFSPNGKLLASGSEDGTAPGTWTRARRPGNSKVI